MAGAPIGMHGTAVHPGVASPADARADLQATNDESSGTIKHISAPDRSAVATVGQRTGDTRDRE